MTSKSTVLRETNEIYPCCYPFCMHLLHMGHGAIYRKTYSPSNSVVINIDLSQASHHLKLIISAICFNFLIFLPDLTFFYKQRIMNTKGATFLLFVIQIHSCDNKIEQLQLHIPGMGNSQLLQEQSQHLTQEVDL